MVSFWPWRNDDTSPAEFERTLATLSTKIGRANAQLEQLKQRSRRLTVLWTLYAGFAYLLVAVILILVVGIRNWGLIDSGLLIGGPLLIYSVRRALATYYDYRLSSLQTHIDDLERSRDSTIERLKAATKYNSTQDLLQRYGGTPTHPVHEKPTSQTSSPQIKAGLNNQQPQIHRLPFAPPPTANIPRRPQSPGLLSSNMIVEPQHPSTKLLPPTDTSPSEDSNSDSHNDLIPSAEFAPNAFSAPSSFAPRRDGTKWYDRIMDVLLGDDETQSSKRFALICRRCRLVNGQAPPGTTSLQEIGKWKCCACQTMNGEASTVQKLISNQKMRQDQAGENAGLSSEQHRAQIQGDAKVHRKDTVQDSEDDRSSCADDSASAAKQDMLKYEVKNDSDDVDTDDDDGDHDDDFHHKKDMSSDSVESKKDKGARSRRCRKSPLDEKDASLNIENGDENENDEDTTPRRRSTRARKTRNHDP